MNMISNTLMGQVDWDKDDGFRIAPARIESPVPNGLRMAQYPDGSLRLQGAYAWSQGDVGGVIWKDLPLVDVDEEGKELP